MILNKPVFLISLSVSLILSASIFFGFLTTWQDKLADFLFTQKENPGEIIIIGIDDQSIRAIGQWPWPRSEFARLIGKLQKAKVIGLDINFKEPSRLGPADDDELVLAFKNSPRPIILTSELEKESKLGPILEKFESWTEVGFANIIISADGVARRIKLSQNEIKSFALLVAESYKDVSGLKDLLNRPIRIFYHGPANNFLHLSFKDVLENKIPSEIFDGKIVLIGATALDLQDYHLTPFSLLSGVEIQANAIQTIISRKVLKTSLLAAVLAVFSMAFLTGFLSGRIKQMTGLTAVIILILVSYNITAFLSFDRLFVLNLLYPNLAILMSATGTMTYQYAATYKEKKFIKETFSRYLAPEVIEEILKNPAVLKLGGQRKELTILFSDIRGFTTISEKMAPEQLAVFLNRYFSIMSGIVLKHRGVIDKFIGDAVMAFWGAPIDNPRQIFDAISTAKEMITGLKKFNEENKKLGYPEINIGIGINHGWVTVGNMGSEKRFDYTVIGDNVNLASRLEGLNKEYRTNIIVSHLVVEKISPQDRQKHNIQFRELGEALVKGKTKPVKIYELLV